MAHFPHLIPAKHTRAWSIMKRSSSGVESGNDQSPEVMTSPWRFSSSRKSPRAARVGGWKRNLTSLLRVFAHAGQSAIHSSFLSAPNDVTAMTGKLWRSARFDGLFSMIIPSLTTKRAGPEYGSVDVGGILIRIRRSEKGQNTEEEKWMFMVYWVCAFVYVHMCVLVLFVCVYVCMVMVEGIYVGVGFMFMFCAGHAVWMWRHAWSVPAFLLQVSFNRRQWVLKFLHIFVFQMLLPCFELVDLMRPVMIWSRCHKNELWSPRKDSEACSWQQVLIKCDVFVANLGM